MTSPFPGMDPYLEGTMWSDVHHDLASAIRELIAPQISPAYFARIERYTVKDTSAGLGLGIMYPDVGVFERDEHSSSVVKEPRAVYASPATVKIPNIAPVEIRIPVIEIKDRNSNRLITAIEILSPVNKRKPGLKPYREKRQSLYQSGVHLLEIDLLRYGTRPLEHPNLPDTHYHISLIRAGGRETEIWGFDIKDTIPIVPVPLKKPDKDVLLDIRQALDMIYKRGIFELSIRYDQTAPPPAFSEEELAWIEELLKSKKV